MSKQGNIFSKISPPPPPGGGEIRKKRPWGKKRKKKKGEKGGEKEGKRGKWRKLMKIWGKNRIFSYFFPKHLQISIFFPHNDIVMGKKYENLLKYPQKLPRALREQKQLVGKKMAPEEGRGGIK